MGALIRAHHWGSTPLGPADSWPNALRTAVELMLAQPLIGTIAVGPERIFLYNDSAAALYGDRHPAALGRPLAETFPESRAVEAFHDRAFAGESVTVRAQPLDVAGEGRGEVFDAYLTPLRDRTGAVIAIVMVGVEIGEEARAEVILREREERQAFLLKLSDRLRVEDHRRAIAMTSVTLLAEHLRLDRAYVAEVDKGGDAAHIGPEFYRADLAPVEGTLTLSQFPEAWSRVEQQTLVLSDTAGDPDLSEADRRGFAALNMGALMVASARRGIRNPVWSLLVATEQPRRWTAAEIALVEDVAERTWAAIERARAEAALAASEEKYRSLFETMGQGYALTEILRDANGLAIDLRMIELNPAYERLMGISAEEARGRCVYELFPDIDRWWLRTYDRIAQSGQFERVENRVGDGGNWFEAWVYPRGNDLIEILFEDVTDRKRAEEALRESEERQRLMVELVPALLWSASPDGQHVRLNERWLAYTGQSEADTQNYGWLDAIHPDDLPETQAAFEHAFATGKPVERQHRVRKENEGYRWHFVRNVPIRDAQGTITRWFGAAVDIHESKLAEAALSASERRLRTLSEGIPQLVWRASFPGQWSWASPQWTDYTGQSDQDSHGWGWLEMVHPDDRDAARAAWAQAAGSGRFEVAYRIHHHDNGWRWFQTRASPDRDPDGNIIEWLGTSTDIDDMRRLENEQRMLLAELQHRVRNTLGVIKSIVRRTADTSETVDEMASHLDGRLSAFARVQSKVTRDAAIGASLLEIVQDELVSHGARIGQTVRVDGPDIMLDGRIAERLSLAIHELATNAVKYGPLGACAGTLVVSWETADDWLRLRWLEKCLEPAVGHRKRRGFGTELLTRVLPYELKAEVSLDFAPTGLSASIDLPLS